MNSTALPDAPLDDATETPADMEQVGVDGGHEQRSKDVHTSTLTGMHTNAIKSQPTTATTSTFDDFPYAAMIQHVGPLPKDWRR